MIPMRRGMIVGVVLAVLCAPGDGWADANGSPASILKKGQWVFGLGGGTMVERGLTGGPETTVNRIGHFRGYGLTDRISLYGTVGGGFIQVTDPSVPTTVSDDFGLGLLLAAQAKARFWRHHDSGLEWDGSVKFSRIRARERSSNDGRWNEWDLSTSVAKPVGRWTPYAGVKMSFIDFAYHYRVHGTTVRSGKYEQDGHFGAFIGTDWSLSEQDDVFLNVETGFTDGAELHLALAYVF